MPGIGQDCKKMKEGKWIHKKTFKATPAKKAAAVMASEKHCGGGRTQIWNRLCHNKIAISLQVTAPPAQDKDEVNSNEQRLHIAICQCDPSLEGRWQDIYGQVSMRLAPSNRPTSMSGTHTIWVSSCRSFAKCWALSMLRLTNSLQRCSQKAGPGFLTMHLK